MKKNLSPLILLFAVLCSILFLNFSLPKPLPEKTLKSDAAVLELLIETPSGDIIDPIFSYSHVDNQFFFQFDGLVDSAEIIGLDEYEDKTDAELAELDEFFEILSRIDGEWLLIDYSEDVETFIENILPFVKTSTMLRNNYLPDSYLPYNDFANDYNMENFTEMFYNIINERVIKG